MKEEHNDERFGRWFIMSKEYGRIKKHEKEIEGLKAQGATQRDTAEQLGFTKNRLKNSSIGSIEKKDNLQPG